MNGTLIYGHAVRQALPVSRRRHVIRILIDGRREPGTFFADVERLRGICGSGWNTRALDLHYVMCTLRAADRYYRSRGLFRDTRQLHIAVTVTDRRRWERVRESLTRTVFMLSGDRLSFRPIRLRVLPRPLATVGATDPEWLERYRPDCLCLFSGGADSFAGAAHLLSIGRRPLLIAHAVGPVSGRQKELFRGLQGRFPHLENSALIQLRSYPRGSGRGVPCPRYMWRQLDDLQRLRSMFFFSLAGIVACCRSLDDIFMCENGVIGAAIAWAPNQHTPYTTRPAEPHYLRQMQRFLRAALSRPSLQIRNPFQYRTKGEVLRECASLGLRRELYRTVSCWRSGNRGVRNCGQCVPCMFRQLSFEEAGLADRRADVYEHPIPRGRRWSRWKSPNQARLLALREYCSRVVAEGGGVWLRSEEPAVADAIDITGGTATQAAGGESEQQELDDDAPERMAATIERFAIAVMAWLGQG